MPTYDYKCEQCGSTQEIFRELGEDREPICCSQPMTRIWTATPVHFKAGGFYSKGG